MIKLTNRTVQENLYEIINVTGDPHIWTHSNFEGEHRLVVKTNPTTTSSYAYETKEELHADYDEIIRIKNKLND